MTNPREFSCPFTEVSTGSDPAEDFRRAVGEYAAFPSDFEIHRDAFGAVVPNWLTKLFVLTQCMLDGLADDPASRRRSLWPPIPEDTKLAGSHPSVPPERLHEGGQGLITRLAGDRTKLIVGGTKPSGSAVDPKAREVLLRRLANEFFES